jgi:hypothetical protein
MTFLQNKIWVSLLIIYPWLFIWQGLDLTDSGYNFVQYSDFFENPSRYGNVLWLSNLLGGIWHEAFEWLGYIGFKIAYILNIYIFIYIAWVLLKKYDTLKVLPFVLFLTMVFAIKSGGYWISYNSFSSLFYMFIIAGIYKAHENDSLVLYSFAGFLAGLNIFIRFPNLLDILLIFPVLVILWKNKQRVILILSTYIAGYILAIITALMSMYLLGQFDSYVQSIHNLFFIASQIDNSHGSGNLLKLLIKDYIMVILMALILFILLKFITAIIAKQNRILRFGAMGIISILSLYILSIMDMWKWVYVAIFYMAMLCIVLDKKTLASLKLLAMLAFLFLALIPLGSGNGIRNMIHGVWLAMPLALLYLSIEKELYLYRWKVGSEQNFIWIKQLFIIVTLGYSLVVAYGYTYRDSNRLSMLYTVDHSKLKGVFTTEKRANIIQELLVKLEPLVKNREMFVYEKLSTLAYLLDKGSALSHPWAVDHLHPYQFKKEFIPYFERTYPIVLRAKYSVSTCEWPYDKKPLLIGKAKELNRQIVEDMLDKYKYKVIWSNVYFEILDRQL